MSVVCTTGRGQRGRARGWMTDLCQDFIYVYSNHIPELLFIDAVVKSHGTCAPLARLVAERGRSGYGSMLALQSLYEHFKKKK